LPMYVIFMALTPLARAVARRWSWDPVIYISLAVWIAAQFGLRDWVYHHVDLFGLGVPETSTGAFDLYAWQLLWMVGLALGSIYADSVADEAPRGGHGESRIPWSVMRLSIILAACFLVLRYSPVDHWMNPDLYGWLIDKWHLGPARVINFSALTIVLVRYGARIANLPIFRPLVILGQASIEVFSVHVLFCIGGDALSHDADPNLPWLQQVGLLIVTISGLFLTGLAVRRGRVAEKEKKETPVPAAVQ
jgi:hypothetical protein